MRATSGDCYAIALKMVGNEHDARDVLQETYLRAFGSLRRFRGDSSFKTWVHRITVNCSVTLVAKRRRHAHAELDDTVQVCETRHGTDPESSAATSDDRERLVAALGELPEQMRIVVVLRDVYDLPHEAIARELGISHTAAKVRLHRARRRLRDQLFPAAPGSTIVGYEEPGQRGSGDLAYLSARRDSEAELSVPQRDTRSDRTPPRAAAG